MQKTYKEEIVLVAGARTAFGAFGGSLANKSSTDLAVESSKGAIARSGVKPESIDYVVVGNVLPTSKDAIYIGRHLALKAGLSMNTPALTQNLLCGSGVQAVATAGLLIDNGQANCVLAAGTEALSMTPYLNWGMRWGGRMGHMEMFDGLDIRDTLPDASMGETAENVQEKYKISRQDQDEYALLSQKRAKAALDAGRLAEEIIPVEIVDKKKVARAFAQDEHMRPETTIDGLAALKPAFKKNGSVTPGNACGIVDGAASLIVTSGKLAERQGLKPLVRVVDYVVVGVPPEIMGIGPVEAIPLVLERTGLKLEQMDLIEINEAFAVQYLACEKALKLDRDKTNVNGGSIAIGHPFGATGIRLLLSISLELQRRKARYGLVSLCVGSGMGIAMIVERI